MGADCDQRFENFLKYCNYIVFEDKTLVFADTWVFFIAMQKPDMIFLKALQCFKLNQIYKYLHVIDGKRFMQYL